MSAPPQGFGKTIPSSERIIDEVINVQNYNSNDSIFPSALDPNVPSGQTIEWTVYYSFVAGGGTSLLYSIDNGANFAIVNNDISSGVAYADKVVVANGDQVIFKFDKNGTINYCRVGEPI